MLANIGEALCSLLLTILATYSLKQFGGRKLTDIMMVAVHHLHVEYGHCTVKQMYESGLNSVVKITKDL